MQLTRTRILLLHLEMAPLLKVRVDFKSLKIRHKLTRF